MKRFTIYAVVGVVALLVLSGFAGRGPLRILKIDAFAGLFFGSDEEAPIIVKNGSMHLITEDKWVENGTTSWSNETPSDKIHRDQFWVKVMLTDNTECTDIGKPVMITYSDTAFHALFTPGPAVNPNDRRTQVTPPKPKLELVDVNNPTDLRHGADGDGNYITGVKVGGGQPLCGDLTKEKLKEVRICSSDNPKCT
jgi:hypothetical protein